MILPLPSFGGRSGALLAISWDRAASHISGLPVSGPLYRLPGRYRGQLEHRGRRAAARGSTRRPTSAVPASTSGWYYPRAFKCLGLVYSQDSHGMQRRGHLARITVSFGRESINHPRTQLQRAGCPDTEDNDRGCRRRIGNDRNQEDTARTASLKRCEPTVIFALLGNLLF